MDIKKDQLVKLITVTITDILAGIELVHYTLHGVNVVDDIVTVKIALEATCLPRTGDVDAYCEAALNIADLEVWLEDGPETFVNNIEIAVVNAFQQKGT